MSRWYRRGGRERKKRGGEQRSVEEERSPRGPGDFEHLQRTLGNRALMEQLEAERGEAAAGPGAEELAATVAGEGDPLPFAERLQEAFRPHDLDGIRVHVGGAAGEAARSAGAEAFAGGEAVAFEGAPDLATAAHEVTHVLQQRAGAVPEGLHGTPDAEASGERRAEATADRVAERVAAGGSAAPLLGNLPASRAAARPPASAGVSRTVQLKAWDPRKRHARVGGLPYAKYKAAIGTVPDIPPLQEASRWKSSGGKSGTRLDPVALTLGELRQILLPEKPLDAEAVKAHDARLADFLPHINTAFQAMGIDTVEAQALYLGHAAGESSTLAELEETGAGKRSYAPFIGRSPFQVTWSHGYVQTLAYLEGRADQLAAQALAADDPYWYWDQEMLLREAVAAVEADFTQAANPKYAFLFSAAYMHMAKGVKASTELAGRSPSFSGIGAEDGWVSGRGRKRGPGGGRAPKTFQQTLNDARVAKAKAEREQGQSQSPTQKRKEEPPKAVLDAELTINDMTSAIARGAIKKATYDRAVAVLKASGRVVSP